MLLGGDPSGGGYPVGSGIGPEDMALEGCPWWY